MKNSILKARAAALLTAGTVLATMSGCDSKEYNLLEGTVLENTVVGSIDGDIAILKYKSSKKSISITDSNEGVAYQPEHGHYQDIVTGEWVTNYSKCFNESVRVVDNIVLNNNILLFLTKEELSLAKEGKLTEEDCINIIYRIQQEEQESEKENGFSRVLVP